MNVQLMGVEMTPDIRVWSNPQRRVGSLLVLGLAALLLVVGVIAYFTAGAGASALYWVLFALLLLVLAVQAGIFVFGLRARSAVEAEAPSSHASSAYAHPEPAMAPAPAPAPASSTKALTLRCGDCGTVFDLADNGERPLYHSCPGCGAEGVLREPAAKAAPAPQMQDFAPPVAAAAPAAKAVKKLKLRCGGCKEIFTIEDSGERPLRRPCPSCSRIGEVR